ncbi:HAD family hydrolase [Paenibacillus sp. J2TS4]|uniref:HAD family hydrolase n=1 Tax=Paenibacillus sp. J2TS4 TaxID=2807194 RepID=UPI001B2DE623|nr:HAD family hydrolase [Paenibacillus sp. J2TS4]GIP31373.1 hypothetical protein J2TS4_05830 [Paenibacillus sp. J2TS4]
MIEAVVFDFDGLIRDTETYEYYSFEELLKEYGVELPLLMYGQRIGGDMHSFCPYTYLEECIGQSLDRESLRKRRWEIYTDLILHEMARPGVENYLASAQAMGLKIGLASSAPYNWVMPNLEELGLTHFQCIRTHEDAAKVKPDPELYLQVLKAFGVRPQHAVAFEDSPNGALAAVRAGMRCVIVPNTLTKQLPFESCDLRLDSMLDMELEEVIARLTG